MASFAGVLLAGLLLGGMQNELTMQIFAAFLLPMLLQNVVLAGMGGVSFSIRTPVSGRSLAVGPLQVSVPRVIAWVAVDLGTIGLPSGLRNTITGKAAQGRRAARLTYMGP